MDQQMPLSDQQRFWLKTLRRFKEDSPATIRRLSYWAVGIGLFIVACALAWVSLELQNDVGLPMTTLIAGFFFGAACRDAGTMLTRAHLWPVWTEIVNWQKVDELLSEDARRQSTKAPDWRKLLSN